MSVCISTLQKRVAWALLAATANPDGTPNAIGICPLKFRESCAELLHVTRAEVQTVLDAFAERDRLIEERCDRCRSSMIRLSTFGVEFATSWK